MSFFCTAAGTAPGAGTKWSRCCRPGGTRCMCLTCPLTVAIGGGGGGAPRSRPMRRQGERVTDFFRQDKASLVARHIHVSRSTLTDHLAPEAYRPALYADCSDADVALAQALLTPEPSLPALTRLALTAPRYGSVPGQYTELTQDRAVTIERQRKMIAASPCATVSSIEASHSAYFSQPQRLVDTVHQTAGFRWRARDERGGRRATAHAAPPGRGCAAQCDPQRRMRRPRPERPPCSISTSPTPPTSSPASAPWPP